MIIPIVIGIIIFFVLIIRGGWIEPDTYAFLSRACGTSEFQTPILSKLLFNAIPCEPIIWYGLQAILWGITIYAVMYSLEKKGISKYAILFMGLSLSTIYALLSFEDDFLITGILSILSYSIIEKNTIRKTIVFTGFIIISTLFIWKGTFIIAGIILLGSINPLLSIIPVAVYAFNNGLNNWQGSIEGIVFNGWTVLFPIIIILFYSSKEKIIEFYKTEKKLFFIFTSLVLLGFYQAKWGLYSALLLPIVMWKIIPEKNRRNLIIFSGIILFGSLIGIGLTKPPHDTHWNLIEEAVEIEKDGGTFYISQSFGLEKWGFEYKGGHPILFPGDNPIPSPFYYLGVTDLNCLTISRVDELRIQYCE